MRKTLVRGTAALAVLTLGVVGCAGKEERAEGGAGGSGWAAGAGTVKIGLIGPMTGPFAVLGVSQEHSIQIVIDQINDAGGIGGAKVKLETRDSGLDPGKAVQAANELAGDDQIKLVVGPSITAFYDATKDIYEQNKKVNCQPAVAAGSFADLKYGFRSQDRLTDDVKRVLQYLKGKGVTSIGEVYESDDTGKQVSQLLTSLAPDYGMTFAGYEQNRTDDQSHRQYVQKLADAGAIWISSSVGGAKTMAAAAEIGYKGIIVSGSGLQNISFIEAAGDAGNGSVFAAPNYQYPIRDRATWKPGYRTHIEAIEKKYGQNVGPKTGAKSPKGTAIAADCMFAYWKAAEAAKSLDPDKVAKALGTLDLPNTQTPSGNAIKPAGDHEFYHLSDISLYEWKKDADGWFTTDVTPKD